MKQSYSSQYVEFTSCLTSPEKSYADILLDLKVHKDTQTILYFYHDRIIPSVKTSRFFLCWELEHALIGYFLLNKKW